MYEPRLYRNRMINERFMSFRVVIQESDLMIGINKKDFKDYIPSEIEKHLYTLRKHLENYIHSNKDFREKLKPVPYQTDDKGIIRKMKEAAFIANTGPMASVAGMVSQEIGSFIKENFKTDELYVENGGDIFFNVKDDIIVNIESGKNKHFNNLGIRLGIENSPSGICTSSGMYGHSYSEGTADSVTVISESAYISDAMATAIANKVKVKDDVHKVLDFVEDELISVVVIKDDQIGIKGRISLEILEKN